MKKPDETQTGADSDGNPRMDEGDRVVRRTCSEVSLDQLLSELRPEQLHGEADFGADVGREVI